MNRFIAGVAVEALKVATAVGAIVCVVGCGPAVATANLDRHVVPNRLVNVTLQAFDVVSFVDVDLHTALQTRDAVESESQAYGRRLGHPRWFFHAFDATNLDFVVARFELGPSSGPRYVAERRLRVKRSREAERALGVTAVVREYEIGRSGVKAGMSEREVAALVGRAEAWIPRSEKGSFDLLYPTFCVRFNGDRVEHIWRRDMCS